VSDIAARVLLEAARAGLSELEYLSADRVVADLVDNVRYAQGKLDIATRGRELHPEEARRCMGRIAALLAYAELEAENKDLVPAYLTQEARRYAECA
jgi:hypothetical protein